MHAVVESGEKKSQLIGGGSRRDKVADTWIVIAVHTEPSSRLTIARRTYFRHDRLKRTIAERKGNRGELTLILEVGPVSHARSRDSPLHLSPDFLHCLHSRTKNPGAGRNWTNHDILSRSSRKSVRFQDPRCPPSHVHLSLSRSFTATHGKWQPYCTPATLANPRTHTTVKTSGKVALRGRPERKTSSRPDAEGMRARDAARGAQIWCLSTRKPWKNVRRCNEPLFTTRLRVRSAVDARVSLASMFYSRY